MLDVKIHDGTGTGRYAKISEEGTLNVVVHPHPPIGEPIAPLPFSQYFENNGSNNMVVNGSVTPVEFSINAIQQRDIYIKSLTVQISDPGARLDRFGAITALTNGIKFFYKSNETGDIVISEAIQTNLDFFRDATGGKGFGSGASSWLADIQGGAGEDTYFPEIDFTIRFGLQWGLRLRKQTEDKLVFMVQDNLAGVSVFNIKAYGITINGTGK
jgi:hypothetical protein